MIAKHRRLRTQMSLAMIFTAVISLMIFILGMAVFYTYLRESWVEGLSRANQETLNVLTENGAVDPDALTTLINAFSLSWSEEYADQELRMLIMSVIAAVIASIFVGVFVARRLSRPIEAVTYAASKVARGQYGFKVDQNTGASIEAGDLLKSFNHMTIALEQAERESTESAAAIAHELRTPLTILRGRLQGLGDGAFDPSPEMFTALVAQADTLSRIVDDLGILSRLSSGQFQPEVQPTDLAMEAQAVLTSLAPDLEREGITLIASLKPAPVNADPARIRQALGALIDNVRKYASSGGYVCVETAAENNFAVLRVIDRGPGIAPADRDRVFDRWWRGDTSRGRSEGGSGLGLSIVHAIARAHNGHATATSGPEQKGAVLSIILPLNSPPSV